MRVRIYQPSPSAMQSGIASSNHWILEFVPASKKELDSLMGWTSSADTLSQVKIKFPTQEEAIDFAKAKNLEFSVQNPKKRKPVIRPRGYAENFAYERKAPWTH